jgi:regulator of replication initiation timing
MLTHFLIRDDIIQVDKAIYAMRFKIVSLKSENKQLKQENEQLKNRPDIVYDPLPKSSMVVRMTKSKIDLTISIDKWATAHFIRMFQELYSKKYDVDFKVNGKSWKVYAFRIKQFRDAHPEIENNQIYKNMIEWLFSHKFNKNFIASVPLITSDAMFYQWLAASKPARHTSAEKFREIAARIPKSNKDIDEVMKDAF